MNTRSPDGDIKQGRWQTSHQANDYAQLVGVWVTALVCHGSADNVHSQAKRNNYADDILLIMGKCLSAVRHF